MRAISGSALAWSNQWNACPEVTMSADPSGTGMASALPASARHAGNRRDELRAHLVERLDRDDPVSARDERTRELPGAGADVDEVARLVADEPVDGIVRIARAAALVRAGDVGERGVGPAHLRIAVDDHAAISAAFSCIATSRGTTSRTLSREQKGMSCSRWGAFSMRFRPLFEARSASSGPPHVVTRRAAASAASVRSQPRSSTIRPATNASSSASAPWTPAQTTTHVVFGVARRRHDGREIQKRRDVDALAVQCGGHDGPSAVRGREDERRAGGLDVLARRVSEIEARDANRVALAAENALAERVAERARLLDLGRAVHALVPCRERLADRRGRPDDVDDDPGRGRSGLVRSERDVDTHAGTLTRRGRGAPLLQTSRPGDIRVVHGVRPWDLPRLHDVWACRDPLP